MSMTRRQKELLDYIRSYTAEHDGVSPSYDEMAAALDLVSKSGIYRLVHALEERGFIRILTNGARSIQLVAQENYRSLLGDALADQLERAAFATNISPTTALRECVRAYIGDA